MLRRTPLKKSGGGLKRSPLKKTGKYIIKSRPKSEEEIIYKKKEAEKMRMFFLHCWNTLPHISEIGPDYKWLGSEPLTLFFHHCFEKSSHPELKYSISNILRVTGDEHSNLNGDLEYYPEAAKKRKYIIDNWNKLVEESKNFEEKFGK